MRIAFAKLAAVGRLLPLCGVALLAGCSARGPAEEEVVYGPIGNLTIAVGGPSGGRPQHLSQPIIIKRDRKMAVRVELVNAGRDALTMLGSRDGQDSRIENFQILLERGGESIMPVKHDGDWDPPIFTLKPGEAVVQTFWLATFVLPEQTLPSGKYQLRVVYRVDPGPEIPTPALAEVRADLEIVD